ncbi:MAG: hypothetical protein HC859_06240 [Bacteroidia bacterium]|nr:hypothetical protein [Bacteroidia bacterium]
MEPLWNFVYETAPRTDLPGTHALKEIKVKYVVNQDTVSVTNYSVYTHTDGGSTTFSYDCESVDPENDASQYRRLMLDSVRQEGMPAYRFVYNTLGLPKRMSTAQDYWGYYNDNSQNTLVPSIPKLFFTGADRTPNTTNMHARSLEKIYWPTGGYTEFVLEPNDYFLEEEEQVEFETTGIVTATANQSTSQSFTIPSAIYGDVK